MLHYYKLINLSKILLITCITFAESISITDKVTKTASDTASDTTSYPTSCTASHESQDNMVFLLSMLSAALQSMEFSKNLHLDTKPMNTSELIACHGYKAEEYTVISNEYNLYLIRIPNDGPSVLLMHGLTGTSDVWLMLGEKSLAIILARLGYDVWLGNARGNTYSRKHNFLSPKDPRFWDFSWHEIGTEDLPACIDHICKIAKVRKITYVGHSQGTTTMSVLLSEMPEYNEKLHGVVFLSAVTYSSNMKSPVFQLLAKLHTEIETALKSLGVYEVVPHRPPGSTATAICASTKQFSTMCMTVLFSLFGFNYEQIDYHHIQAQLRSTPGGCSWKQLIHYLQIIFSGLFRNYDYGIAGNMETYGCDAPPSYELENFSANLTIFYSNNDWVSNFEKDVSQMIARLPTPPKVFEVEHEMWNHNDYLWGKDADSLVYYLVEKMLRKYNSLTSCYE